MPKVLEVSHLNKVFHSKKESFQAVKDVSLTIDEGEILSIIGPNGAGKTTLLSMLGGYLLPSSGSILVKGVDVLADPHQGLIGVSFGGDLGFYDKVSAQDNLSFFADLTDIPSKERKKEVDRVLAIVKLTDQRNKTVEHFSKGMKQRLHIARALLGQPALLLLDEPTNGIDVEISQEIHQTIRDLASQEGLAVLLTSHMMGEVESLAKRIILLGRGEIQYQGTVADIVKLSGVEHIDRPATLEESYLALAPRLRWAYGSLFTFIWLSFKSLYEKLLFFLAAHYQHPDFLLLAVYCSLCLWDVCWPRFMAEKWCFWPVDLGNYSHRIDRLPTSLRHFTLFN